MRKTLLAPELAESENYRTLGELRSAEQLFDLQWVLLEVENGLINKTIGEAEIRKTTGVSLVAVIRKQKLIPNPDAAFRFELGDQVAIIGSTEARCKFRGYSATSDNLCSELFFFE